MKNKILKLLVSCISLVFGVNGTVPIVSVADEYEAKNNTVVFDQDSTLKQRVVVSMGDSYSSGEGLGSYYGSSDPNSGDEFVEFLAHQSKNSWPGMLELPEVGKMSKHKAQSFPDYSYDPNAKLQWYFVASSGAETKDILGYNKKSNGKTLKNVGQEKEYSIPKDSVNLLVEVRSTYFNPQISVLEFLEKQRVVPDYITLTIGGNDLGFANIISEACTENRYYTYFLTNSLKKKIDDAQNKLDYGTKEEKSVREKLRETYKAINDVFKDDYKKPCILVAGYPILLDPNGKGLFIEKEEASNINDSVTYFNKAIEKVVETSRIEDGLDIEYINVEKAFGTTHGAYSKEAWINEVVPVPRESDINKAIYIKRKDNWLNIASAQSMHPNKEGAKCYAKCFQKVINSREKDIVEETLTPTPIPTFTNTPTPTPILVPIFPETTSLNPTKESESDSTSSNSTLDSSSETTQVNKPEVKVTNAEKKTKNTCVWGYKFTCRIPKVSISGKNMDSINKKMKQDAKKGRGRKIYDYSYYVDDSIISIIIRITDDWDSPLTEFKTYNISISNGKLMKDEDVIKLCKTTTNKFFSKVKKIYSNDYYKSYIERFHDSKEGHKKYNLNHVSYKYIDPYIDKNGHLCFVANMFGVPPAGCDTLRFDTKTMKVIHNWEGKFI